MLATKNVSCSVFFCYAGARQSTHNSRRKRHMAEEHRLYGLIGYPITFVRSPGILNAYLAEHHLPGRMIPFGVRPEALETALAGLSHVENLAGFFVTMPFKQSILPLLDDASETA